MIKKRNFWNMVIDIGFRKKWVIWVVISFKRKNDVWNICRFRSGLFVEKIKVIIYIFKNCDLEVWIFLDLRKVVYKFIFWFLFFFIRELYKSSLIDLEFLYTSDFLEKNLILFIKADLILYRGRVVWGRFFFGGIDYVMIECFSVSFDIVIFVLGICFLFF